MEKIFFSEMKLSEQMLKAIEDVGFEEATTIQSKTIPLILNGRDVTGHSQTGTGKTAAFGIPALEMIDPEDKKVQVLVLCPTRELSIQASDEIRKFAKYKNGIKILPIYGGQPIDRQIKALKQGIQFVIGTPGRVMDHMRRKTLKMETVKIVVLDEADEMLNMGFREDIDTIMKDIPSDRQTILFSATMSDDILRITREYQKNSEFVKVVHKQLTVPGIDQYYFEVSQGKKTDALCRVLDMYNPKLSLVFCNTKKMVDELVNQLQFRGYLAEGLHGDMKQPIRTRVMGLFRSYKIDVLVATDVAARGIDVDDVEAVFNYDIPEDEEYYVHRIGRTGRAGKTGRAFTFAAGRKQIYALRDIERYTNSKILQRQLPSIDDIEEIKINNFLNEIRDIVKEKDSRNYIRYVERLMEEDINSIDIAAALIKKIVKKDNDSYDDDSKNMKQEFYSEEKMVRLFINIGKKDRIQPGDILGAIAGETGIHGKLIGSIDMYDKFTFVEVPVENSAEVLDIMKNSKIKGKKINIERARDKN